MIQMVLQLSLLGYLDSGEKKSKNLLFLKHSSAQLW